MKGVTIEAGPWPVLESVVRDAAVRSGTPPPVRAGRPAALVEAALLPNGWRLEHPAVRGVLRGPQGQALDAKALVARAAIEPAARAELGALLGDQPAAAATAAATSARSVGSDQGPTR